VYRMRDVVDYASRVTSVVVRDDPPGKQPRDLIALPVSSRLPVPRLIQHGETAMAWTNNVARPLQYNAKAHRNLPKPI
jgi:hypothetical protein